ncbi:MAG: GHKL domain-containing protein [Phycisphaerae bacterium]|nr:GHKL domain-containing protein [Phycisphaerae bacterium]
MKRRLALVYVLGALTGTVVIVSMACSYRTAVRMSATDIPQLGAAGQITLAVSGAHRRSTGMPGDDDPEFDEIRRSLDSARVCTQALLYGGQTTHDAILPLKDEVLRQVAAGMDTLLADFMSLTHQRCERPAEFGGAAEQQYNLIYDEIMGKTGTLAAHLRARIDADLGRSRLAQAAVIGLCALGLTAATYIAGLLVRRHSLDAARLVAVNQQLQAHEQQLLAANQQLQAGEQQLRATNQQLQAANQQLQAREREYRLLFSEMISGFAVHEMIYDEDGNPVDYRFLEINAAFEALTGLKRADVLGRTATEVLPEIDRFWITTYGGVATTGKPVHFEHYSKDIPAYFDVIAYRPAPGQFAVIFNNVTERRGAERELKRLNRILDSRNKELQSIVYAASHDLRSPLVNIQGFGGELAEYCRKLRRLLSNVQGAEEWRKEINGVIEKDVPEALKFIRAGARKMQTLLDGLLSVSRVGSVELAIETLDMETLLLSVIAATRYQIDTASAEVIVDSLPPCRGDAAQVNQVFSNLIVNALKYASPLRKPRVCITGVVEEYEVIYCVEDNGIGIAAQYQEKIFEIFHRLNPGDAHDGEGIGLTIVSRIVDRHDGRVWVESEDGEGSRFFVALPKV